MGDPRRLRKKYENPKRPWDKARILSEKVLVEKYGLTSKKELRIMEAFVKRKRDAVKKLLAESVEVAEKGKANIIGSLNRLGLVSADATIADILGLDVTDILERRLQTLVFRQGLAKTPKQARQFIIHGFIAVNGRRIRTPGYIVKKEEENTIGYFENRKPKVLDTELKKPELQQKPSENEGVESNNIEKTTDNKDESIADNKEIASTPDNLEAISEAK